MTYTGDVELGGGMDLRQLSALEIRKMSVSDMDNNAYLLTCRASGAQLLIDASDNVEALLALVRAGNEDGRLDWILTTHRHEDHSRVLESMVVRTGARTLAGLADAIYIPVPPSYAIQHGNVVKFGKIDLEIISLRGHTEGSVAVLYRDKDESGEVVGEHLFSGDSLFPGGVGATSSDKNFQRLFGDVTRRVFDVLPDRTWVYPGHGADTTLGAERPHLAEWKRRGW